MSALETPAQPRAAEPRDCPRCGAALAPEQDWCLHCGEAVSTRVAPAPSWRLPVAIVAGVLTAGAVILALAFLELSDDADRTARAPAPTPSPTAEAVPTTSPVPTPSGTPTPAAAETPSATPSATPPPSGAVADWPAGEEAWTVVLLSGTDRAAAEKRARELAAGGTQVGVLRSDDYASLRPGYWVVFSGRYETQQEAQEAAKAIGAKAAGSYARFVDPK